MRPRFSFALATFLGRFWSTPNRLLTAFPIDRRELAGHAALGLTEARVRGAIRTLEEVGFLDRAVASGVVPEREVRRWEADYIHQFILAGAYRRLRVRRRAETRDVLQLFDLPAVKALGPSPKWLPVRLAFSATAKPSGVDGPAWRRWTRI